MGQVLEFLVMAYTDNLKWGVTRSIRELNIKVAKQLFLKKQAQLIIYKILEKTAL